jgi:KDO2-lipid IV(A) lauroyltransferase
MDHVPTPDAINREVEAIVRRRPDQYVWSYNRYKQPPVTAAAAAPGAAADDV